LKIDLADIASFRIKFGRQEYNQLLDSRKRVDRDHFLALLCVILPTDKAEVVAGHKPRIGMNN